MDKGNLKIGIYNPYLSTKGGGEGITCVLAEILSRKYSVEIITHSAVEKSDLENIFSVNLKNVTIIVLKKNKIIDYITDVNRRFGRLRGVLDQLILNRQLTSRCLDLFINNYYLSYFPAFAKKGIYICMFPQKIIKSKKEINDTSLRNYYERLICVLSEILMKKNNFLQSYQNIIAISSYTRKWIKRYWSIDSELIYPPCRNIGFYPERKENIIISVGRFFVGGHNKKHELMIEAFKKLKLKKFELHLIGTIKKDNKSNAYFSYLKKISTNYRIYFHANISADDLSDLYQRAKIYWHAAGFGENENRHPEKLEHFGISTVEAMSAGVIPIVIKKGGQEEIFRDGKDGFYWNNLDELINKTKLLINSQDLLSKMQLNAIRRSKLFNKENFSREIDKIVNNLLDDKYNIS